MYPAKRRDDGPERPWQVPRAVRRVLVSLAPVVCPDEVPVPDLEERVVTRACRTISAIGEPQRTGLSCGIVAYDLGALPRHGRRAHKLERAPALAYFQAWLDLGGPLHEVAKALRGILCMAYYEVPEVLDHIDYHPEVWIRQVTTLRHKRYGLEILHHQRALLEPDPLLRDHRSAPSDEEPA